MRTPTKRAFISVLAFMVCFSIRFVFPSLFWRPVIPNALTVIIISQTSLSSLDSKISELYSI